MVSGSIAKDCLALTFSTFENSKSFVCTPSGITGNSGKTNLEIPNRSFRKSA